MNQLKSLLFLPVRGYSRKVLLSKKVSWKKPKPPAQPDPIEELFNEEGGTRSFFDQDFEDEGEYDAESMESTFECISNVESVHRREMELATDKLKTKIAIRKSFTTKEPNFLTWSERVQIKSLYDENNEKWNLEMLSQAFPALPGTIKKVLDSRRQPKTAEEVVKYDQQVIENWEQFKLGNLALDPRLEAHLNEFKGRKIQITDLKAAAEKFVKPKPIFPAPRSTLFTSIVKNDAEKLEANENPKPLQIEAKSTSMNAQSPGLIQSTALKKTKNISSGHERLTFDSFVQKKVDEVAGNLNPSLEDQLLVDVYKQKLNDSSIKNDICQKETAITEQTPANLDLTPSDNAATVKVDVPEIDFDKDQMATGILDWKKKEDVDNEDYSKFIKIPRKHVKSQVTFRVKNRYYDSDGEFLYKVPGLQL